MINTVISRCKKSDFKASKQIADSIFDLRWGKQNEVERIEIIDELTEEIKEEIRETDYCTYELCRWYGNLTPELFVKNIQFKRRASMIELNEILPDSENKLKIMKDYLIQTITEYDKSDNINQFYIGEYATWLDKATRVGLKLRFESELAQGMTDTILWQNNISFPLNLQEAIQMLYAIEIYASACYDNTQMHLSAVNNIETIDELLTYDYTVGYPEKLKFS